MRARTAAPGRQNAEPSRERGHEAPGGSWGTPGMPTIPHAMQTQLEPSAPESPDFLPRLFVPSITSFRVMLPTAVPFLIPGIHYGFGLCPVLLP